MNLMKNNCAKLWIGLDLLRIELNDVFVKTLIHRIEQMNNCQMFTDNTTTEYEATYYLAKWRVWGARMSDLPMGRTNEWLVIGPYNR
jgi:hypothetical protein